MLTTGNGENKLVNDLNKAWGDDGHAFRLQQRFGTPDVVSDVILGLKNGKTYSIEVKWIKVTKKKSGKWGKPKAQNFNCAFSISTRKDCEFPHQLTRQVMLSNRLGWTPYVLFIVNYYKSPRREHYLVPSSKLLTHKENGYCSCSYEQMQEWHDVTTYDYLMTGVTE